MYGRLVNGQLVIDKVSTANNKIIIYTSQPQSDEYHLVSFRFEEEESNIVQIWEINELNNDLPVDPTETELAAAGRILLGI